MAERIEQYTPEIPDAHWAAIEGFVRSAVTDAQPSTPYRARDLLGAVTAFVRWAWMEGHELERRVIFDRWTIERFIATGCPPSWSSATRGNRRSMLFRMSEALLGHEARIPRVAPIPASDPAAPYTAADLIGFRTWAASQSTPGKRSDCLAVVAFGAGAGLATEDLLPLRATDVEPIDGAWVVNVTGRRTREVPVLANWAAAVTAVLDEREADEFVFRPGRTTMSKNSVSNLMGRTTGTTKPQPQRLRATWIVHHLTVGTPVRALMAAAGVQSLEALTRYLRFVPDIDPHRFRRVLRGEVG